MAVVTTPFSFFASVSSILRAGATPVLADIDPATFNLDAAAVEAVLNAPQPTPVEAILPVHLYGQCADWTSFARIGKERALKLIEDAAQAYGAEWQGTKAGALGDAAAFSFYPTKNLSAAGDAGMVTTNSGELAEHVRALRQHGMKRRYYHDEVGWFGQDYARTLNQWATRFQDAWKAIEPLGFDGLPAPVAVLSRLLRGRLPHRPHRRDPAGAGQGLAET